MSLFFSSSSHILAATFLPHVNGRYAHTVEHNHVEDTSRVEAAEQAGCLIYRSMSSIGSRMDKLAFDCTMTD